MTLPHPDFEVQISPRVFAGPEQGLYLAIFVRHIPTGNSMTLDLERGGAELGTILQAAEMLLREVVDEAASKLQRAIAVGQEAAQALSELRTVMGEIPASK